MENYKRIINGKYNNIYKGHVLQGTTTDSKICLTNMYFDTAMSEEFDLDHKRTYRKLSFSKANPKWLIKALNDTTGTDSIIFNGFVNESKLKVALHNHYTVFNLSEHFPGIDFCKPEEQIQEIKNFKKLVSAFNKRIKKNKNNLNDYIIYGFNNDKFTLNDMFFNEFDVKIALDDKVSL